MNTSSDSKSLADLAGVANLYSDGLKEHGTSSSSVGWRDDASHRLRFEKLAYLFDAEVEPACTVADLGCGYAAFFDFLLERGIPLAGYVGYDISPDMLRQARQRIASPLAEFVEAAEVDREVDYSVVCGTYNVRLKNSEDRWRDYVVASLRKMHEFSRRGFSFNLLSTYVDFKEDHLFYADPLYFFDLCKTQFSRHVSLLHDYKLYEWTIVVRK